MIKLDGKQRRAWVETRTKLLYDAPMFSHLLYTQLTKDEHYAEMREDIPASAWTDGERIGFKPSDFLARPLLHRVFILGHEVVHAMLDHPGMMLRLKRADEVRYTDGHKHQYHDPTMQFAADVFVNALLIESQIGECPSDANVDERFTTKHSVLDIYRALMDQNEQKDGGGGFDQLMDPGATSDKNPDQAMQDRDEDQWQMQIKAGLHQAKAMGKLPTAMEQALLKATEPQVPWQEHVVTLLHRALGYDRHDWRRPDRRMITRPDPVFMPARSGHGAGLIVVVGDSSGSINQPTEAHFMGELGGILSDLNPELIMFVWCDARTHGWEDIYDADDLARVQSGTAKGKGGTDFRPPFAELEDMGEVPDALIYLTDGYGPFPDRAPHYPVIWGDISGRPSAYPFGSVVQIPVKKVAE